MALTAFGRPSIMLKGGPANGRIMQIPPGSNRICVPVMNSDYRPADFQWSYSDPILPDMRVDEYDAMTGEYIGVQRKKKEGMATTNFYGKNATLYIDTANGPSKQIQAPTIEWKVDGLWDTINTTKEQTGMQLFSYAVLYMPRNDDDTLDQANAKILIEPTTILAKTRKAVEQTAIRALTDDKLDMEFVEVHVSPFAR